MTAAALLVILLSADVQILPPAELAAVRRNLPQLADDEYRQQLKEAIWYDRQSLGVVYQLGVGLPRNGDPIGFGNANYNISADYPESQKAGGAGGNANTSTHFPWMQKPGGTHRSPTVDSVTGFWLPPRPDGGRWPVVWYRTLVPRVFAPQQRVRAWNWSFPVGTRFFEILYQRAPDGEVYPFEVRIRSRDLDRWIPDVLRPFPTAEVLRSTVEETWPAWRANDQLRRLVDHLADSSTVRRQRLRDNNRTEKAFDVLAGVDVLPPIDHHLVGQLLDETPFTSALAAVWKHGETIDCFAPTTEAEFHVVPQYYDGTFLGTSMESCSRCHEGGLTSSRRWDINTGWYGYVRGNRVSGERGGSILSWHPIEPTAITNDVSPPTFNRAWLEAGIIAEYAPDIHPKSVYRRLWQTNSNLASQ